MIGIKEYQQILTEDLPKPVIKRLREVLREGKQVQDLKIQLALILNVLKMKKLNVCQTSNIFIANMLQLKFWELKKPKYFLMVLFNSKLNKLSVKQGK